MLLFLLFALGLGQLSVTILNASTAYPHIFEECVGSGNAAMALRADWQKQLAQARKDIGFKRVRFHGIFDDNLSVLQKNDTSGELYTSFFNVDLIYDYITSLGMAPLVELSFMPKLLASETGPNATGKKDECHLSSLKQF
jgi:xylan 1,4-beta-xylosidase